MIPKGYESATPGTMPDPEAVEKMMEYNEALKQAGVLVSLEGLHPPAMGARVHFKENPPRIEPGPFAGISEVVGGFWILDVESKEEALGWASRCPASENEIIDDFPKSIQKAIGKSKDLLERDR
jgi:hypothetical protein